MAPRREDESAWEFARRALEAREFKWLCLYTGECNFNAAAASREAGYGVANARDTGHSLRTHAVISAAIEEVLSQYALTVEECLAILRAHATGTMGDFLRIEDGQTIIDMDQAAQRGVLHLVKRYSDSPKFGVELELHDAQAAIQLIGKQLGLFRDRVEMTGANGGPLGGLSDDELDQRIAELAQRTTPAPVPDIP